MSTTSSTAECDRSLPAFEHPSRLDYVATHVSLPLKLPGESDYSPQNDLSLVRAVCAAAHSYSTRIHGTSEHELWHRITKMLDNLQLSIQCEPLDDVHVISQLSEMRTGDILAFFIRHQNSGIVLTKRENSTLCESFEVSPPVEKMLRSYPSSDVEVFDDGDFHFQLAKFLSRPTNINSTAPPPLSCGSLVELLTGTLRGIEFPPGIPHITKRVCDHVGPSHPYMDDDFVWRRSSLWLFIRITIQMSLDRTSGLASYKRFMLFFISTLAKDGNDANLSNDLLYSLSCKTLRRLRKLGTSTPCWLSEMALQASTCLRETLDIRIKLNPQPLSFQNPSEDELGRDTKLSLQAGYAYICEALADHDPDPLVLPFRAPRRGTLQDFLSSNGTFFDEAHRDDPKLVLYDVEQSVEQGIDDWIACVTDVDDACGQLEILMNKYVNAHHELGYTPEISSIRFLTTIELFIALDKLVLAKLPMLADYCPEIPVAFLETFLLRNVTSLHRLSCAIQYLCDRQSRSRPGWSVLSSEFSEDSFPVRYYDQSPHLQHLRARIEEDAMQKVPGDIGLQQDGGEISRFPLPSSLVDSKVILFELDCPACFRSWRSAIARVRTCFSLSWGGSDEDSPELAHNAEQDLLAHAPELQPYFTGRKGPELPLEIHIVYSFPRQSENRPKLCYVLRHFYHNPDELPKNRWYWWHIVQTTLCLWEVDHSYCKFLYSRNQGVTHTSHTSNNVLAAQVDCPADFSLDEFIAFGHLRSGGSLQWLNILHGLHNRTLNLRHIETHHLLSQAVFQVGPVDLNTGMWIWHQELEDTSFCNALFDEIESLFADVGAGLIDDVLMNSISLIVTRVLASSPSEVVTQRAITILRHVRRQTFNWVEELLYNQRMEPKNEVRTCLLFNMAATCRSTFNVDVSLHHKVCHSAEGVDSLLGCALLMYNMHHPGFDGIHTYPGLLFDRDRRLSFQLEGILRDVILADPSDHGVDLAVAKIFTLAEGYQPSVRRWEGMQSHNTCWLTCKTETPVDHPSRVICLNLLNAKLRLDSDQSINGSLEEIGLRFGYSVPPSMSHLSFDLETIASKHVIFLIRNKNLVIRARCNKTGDTLELIPWGKLTGDLPPWLINYHFLWLNLSTKTIEIRGYEQLWEESLANWRIDCTPGQYRAYKGHETLVDPRSPTWAMVSECFKCLNDVPHNAKFLITVSSVDSPGCPPARRFVIALGHYSLSFFVNEREEIESGDFKDMVYDEDQCVGALFGLENMLVLRQKSHITGAHIPEGLTHRLALIPEGSLSREKDQVHIRLDPHYAILLKGVYDTYNVDTELGCLVGNGKWGDSMRNLAALHANTNCYRPDPLTRKTGAQASLSLSGSPGCQSIMIKNKRDISRTSNDRRRDSSRNEYSTLEQLLYSRTEPELPKRSTLLLHSHTRSSNNILDLSPLFTPLSMHKGAPLFQQSYVGLLKNSAQYASKNSRTVVVHELPRKDEISTLQEHYIQCRSKYISALNSLNDTLSPNDPVEKALEQFGQWPPITGDYLLRCLSSTSPIKVPPDWKKCIISLALLLLDLQRARRLLRFALDSLEEEFSKELENGGCDGWKAEDYPDWLLIQIQGNFLIRRTQAETAMAMILPESQRNTVMQVNMGEGKSSVIVPIIAAALADGKQLVRVIVPKALTVQMFELLVTRLGGLTNRQIYYLPFTRSVEHNLSGEVISLQVDDLQMLMSRCMAERGILLVQREHLLSLKLTTVYQQIPKSTLTTVSFPNLEPQKSIDKLIMTARSLSETLPRDSSVSNIYEWFRQLPALASGVMHISEVDSALDDESGKWLRLQKWLDSSVRDLLDESDELLHPRFQLIYTIGLQQHMDAYPDRWTITQQVLRLVREHITSLSKDPSTSACDTSGSFPDLHTMRASEIDEQIIPAIVENVMAGQLPRFNIKNLPPGLKDAIHCFISHPDVSKVPPTTIKRVEDYAKSDHQDHLWSGLLLLRGLLACKILSFALAERRWRVDYGLDLPEEFRNGDFQTVTELAVPYRAKDTPAPDTQFGHPDITIILTCLSYYYAGLTEKQLRASFKLLLDQDHPSTEYRNWIQAFDEESLPDSLREFRQFNIDSSEQWDKVIFPRFFRNQATIDFYLSQVVFPKEAKEFPSKISASGWDLAEEREKLITGFSGTNDSRWLLPTSIAQDDLQHQAGTNARVLSYILQRENDHYMVVQDSGRGWNTPAFLRMLTTQRPEIRVLLDVGAQVLDLDNHDVAEEWLDASHDAAGAIYFNSDDELMILARSGHSLPMSSSPLSERLDCCVVYLDHSHTRGTDLKLPVGSRAAVTLCPKLTKDTLVQACMRMRKLGHGHSVMFFAPLEVDQSIRAVATQWHKDPNAGITTVDILAWAIHQTWADIQKRAPYWAQQGMNHRSRYEAWTRFCNGELTPEKLAEAWVQRDTKSLANLYAPSENNKTLSSLSELDPEIQPRCKTLGVLSLSKLPSAQMEEEQEREVNREREREREVELPPKAEPAEHSLHLHVTKFVKTGDIDLHARSAFLPIFTTLEKTSAATMSPKADVWSPFILATVDFSRTIEPGSTKGTIDQYLRPVQWILTRSKMDPRHQVLVLLSPFEANALIPDIRASKYVHLHLYAPRTSHRMKPSDDLKLYSIPPLPSDWTPPWDLIDQLNVFAGQLYLRDYTSYQRLCRFLRVGVPPFESENAPLKMNSFDILGGSWEESKIRPSFASSPLPFVMALLAMRSRGRPFADSHMGKILQGQGLTEKDFDEISRRSSTYDMCAQRSHDSRIEG